MIDPTVHNNSRLEYIEWHCTYIPEYGLTRCVRKGKKKKQVLLSSSIIAALCFHFYPFFRVGDFPPFHMGFLIRIRRNEREKILVKEHNKG